MFSCDKLKPEKGFDEKMLIKPEIVGKYHRLDKENIEIFLPEGFYLLDDDDLNEIHSRIEDENIRNYYEQAYEIESFMKHKLYRFYSKDYGAEVVIKPIPYVSFNKSDARQLLYYLRKSFEGYQDKLGINHKKIKSTYFGNKSKQIFKAIYGLSRIKNIDDDEIFKAVYIISANKKTFMLTILTPFEFDYDPLIKKIRL